MTPKTCSFLLVLLMASPASARSLMPASDASADLKRCQLIREEAIKYGNPHLMREYNKCMSRILRGQPAFPSGPVRLPSDDD
ncbi:hypothetical protein [Cohaesibacter haloalkalitolerans]|uniref:hypothetical protein n=1 Tax=Cohaesibacter haloalkalitolerans TaxID=1162980 RepID=UPI000E654675|nr:hypothetical protein [Cohaesibacter haloalkalitolerans]